MCMYGCTEHGSGGVSVLITLVKMQSITVDPSVPGAGPEPELQLVEV